MNHISVWNQLVQLPYLNLYSKLVNAALELDVFSYLSEPETVENLAVKLGWNTTNTGYFLGALSALGFVTQAGGKFQNTEEAMRYLVKGSPEYLGGFILTYLFGYNEKMLERLED